MAKRLKAPINFIIQRITGSWDHDCEWIQERFRQSINDNPSDDNMAILKALQEDDDEFLMFAIEHLIHCRCSGLDWQMKLIKKAREIDWRI